MPLVNDPISHSQNSPRIFLSIGIPFICITVSSLLTIMHLVFLIFIFIPYYSYDFARLLTVNYKFSLLSARRTILSIYLKLSVDFLFNTFVYFFQGCLEEFFKENIDKLAIDNSYAGLYQRPFQSQAHINVAINPEVPF